MDMAALCCLFLHEARGRQSGLAYMPASSAMASCEKATICGPVRITDHDDMIYG